MKALSTFCKGFDCVVVQPTASGKSICYQVPALMSKDKFLLVIFPTVALMESQVKSLTSKGIDAVVLGPSANNPSDFYRVFNGLDSLPSLVCMKPEYLIAAHKEQSGISRPGCLSMLQKISSSIAMIAIDECYKIFERSGDFRYLTKIQAISTIQTMPFLKGGSLGRETPAILSL